MNNRRTAAREIAYAGDRSSLPPLRRALIPLLSLVSSIYGVAVSLRRYLYRLGLLPKYGLPVPVISVGNLTWGGNDKSPMFECIAKLLVGSGIPPLILTRGYAGGDEARMLQRHFLSKSVQVGVGTNRAAIAMNFLRKYGYRDPHSELYDEKVFLEPENGDGALPKLGAAILDDAMQHLQLISDVNIVMVNGLLPWGNGHLIPLGPLREPLTALERAEIFVIHNADMSQRADFRATYNECFKFLTVSCIRTTLMNFCEVQDMNFEIPLEAVSGKVVFCLSAIGSANAFVQSAEKLGAHQVNRLDFSDHHSFNMMDIGIIKQRLWELDNESGIKPVVILTEKILRHLGPYRIWALCGELQFIPAEGSN